MLFTKITPAVGLVWHAVRREWRSLGVAAGVTRRDSSPSGRYRVPSYGRPGSIRWPNADQTYEVGHPLGPLLLRVILGSAIVA